MPRSTTLHYAWRSEGAWDDFRSAVSLHSHTLHSRESLDFIPQVCGGSAILRRVLRACDDDYRRRYGRPLDFARCWWTPPVCATQALTLERRQIEDALDLRPLVSLTDHDNIEAAHLLSMTSNAEEDIRSIEWTVPVMDTFLHLGVHNLPPGDAEARVAALNSYTASPDESRLPMLLDWIASCETSLVVLNHPFWDEKGIGQAQHVGVVRNFLQQYGTWIHALELNGLRSWRENAAVLEFADEFGMLSISGGDRHATEPNAILNLSPASTFAEFAASVRNDGASDVLFMPHFRQPRVQRILHNLADILGKHPFHSLGHTTWSERIFYRCDDGSVKSLHELCSGRPPAALGGLIEVTQLLRHHPVRSALRFAFGAEEVA